MRLGEIEHIHTVKPLFEPVPLAEPEHLEPAETPQEQPVKIEEPVHDMVGV